MHVRPPNTGCGSGQAVVANYAVGDMVLCVNVGDEASPELGGGGQTHRHRVNHAGVVGRQRGRPLRRHGRGALQGSRRHDSQTAGAIQFTWHKPVPGVSACLDAGSLDFICRGTHLAIGRCSAREPSNDGPSARTRAPATGPTLAV